MKLYNLLLNLLLLFNWKLGTYAIQKNYLNENLKGIDIGIGYHFKNSNILKNCTSIFFNYFFSDKNESYSWSTTIPKEVSIIPHNKINIIFKNIIFFNETQNRNTEWKTKKKILKGDSISNNNDKSIIIPTYSNWLLDKQILNNNFWINHTDTISELQNNSINGKYLNLNDKFLRELSYQKKFINNYQNYIATIPLDLLKNNTLAKLDTIGFKALILYTPYSMNEILNVYIQDIKKPSYYIKNKLESLKIYSYTKNLFLQSTIKLSTPCFYTLSDIRELRNESRFKEIKKEYKNYVNEKFITIYLNCSSNFPFSNEINSNGKRDKEVIKERVELYSRSYIYSSLEEEEEEENSGLLILWIVLGIIGFIFCSIVLSYIVNYIRYNCQNNLMDNPNQENFDITIINPMPLDYTTSFGHNQQNLNKEELDKCPVFRFKNNKKHQYKKSNSSFKNNIPNIYNKNLLKSKNIKENNINQKDMCYISDRNDSIITEKSKDNDVISYIKNDDTLSIQSNNNRSIRYIFDDSIIDDNKEYPSSIKSTSITSSYSEIYNHLPFNPDSSSSAEICAICIEHYQFNDELRKLPCGHEFHKECIDSWMLTSSVLCPICKMDIHDYFVKKEQEKRNVNRQENII